MHMLRYQGLTIIWAAMLLMVTLAPGANLNQPPIAGFIQADKVIHTVLFGGLSFLMLVGFMKISPNKSRVPKQLWQQTTAICLGYGIIIEFLQISIPDRHFEYSDILANLTGIILGLLLFWLVYRIPFYKRGGF